MIPRESDEEDDIEAGRCCDLCLDEWYCLGCGRCPECEGCECGAKADDDERQEAGDGE